MRTWLGETRKAPWTLWAYLGASAVEAILGGLVGASAHPWTIPISIAVEVLFAFFLLRGSRVMWWLLVVIEIGSVPFFFFGGDHWWHAPFLVAEITLLLSPPSRRYVFSSPTPSPQSGGSWDSAAHDDSARPPGWYLDPGDSKRMRYWDIDLGGWQSKTTKAPRKQRTAPSRLPAVTWDASFYDDEDRPPGWFFDPADPNRMRYWDSELGGWQAKTTRAPRRARGRDRA